MILGQLRMEARQAKKAPLPRTLPSAIYQSKIRCFRWKGDPAKDYVSNVPFHSCGFSILLKAIRGAGRLYYETCLEIANGHTRNGQALRKFIITVLDFLMQVHKQPQRLLVIMRMEKGWTWSNWFFLVAFQIFCLLDPGPKIWSRGVSFFM